MHKFINQSLRHKIPALFFLVFLVFSLLVSDGFAQSFAGKWDGVEGKKIVNHDGITLGYVSDIAVDLENGRYVGVIIPVGGFMGIGAKQQVVPAAAFTSNGTRNTLFLNMDRTTFRNAPTFEMTKVVGPPQAAQVAAVYQYFGQNPYFTTQTATTPLKGERLEQLGRIKRGSGVLHMTVENLQGKPVGNVFGFHGLDRATGLIGGVVISQNTMSTYAKKIVQSQDLRFNLRGDRLRINNHEQEFTDSPDFVFRGEGRFHRDSPERPGTFQAPLVQGAGEKDKQITLEIRDVILAQHELSHYARNIQIATVNGKTMLRGRVETENDKNEIVTTAVNVAGRGNVSAQIEVQAMSRAEENIDTKPAS